jgi:transketolase N-terminal domain/subunit
MTNPSPTLAAAAAAAERSHVPRAQHERMANAIRALAMDAVEQAKSGHPGLPMGAADIATVLFTRFLKLDSADPAWPDRDRFVLSAGHGSMLIYALLHLLGYENMTIEEIKRFRQLGSLTRRTSSPWASRPRPDRSAKGSATPSAWPSPSATLPRYSVTRSWTIIPMCSPPTAISWRE